MEGVPHHFYEDAEALRHEAVVVAGERAIVLYFQDSQHRFGPRSVEGEPACSAHASVACEQRRHALDRNERCDEIWQAAGDRIDAAEKIRQPRLGGGTEPARHGEARAACAHGDVRDWSRASDCSEPVRDGEVSSGSALRRRCRVKFGEGVRHIDPHEVRRAQRLGCGRKAAPVLPVGDRVGAIGTLSDSNPPGCATTVARLTA